MNKTLLTLSRGSADGLLALWASMWVAALGAQRPPSRRADQRALP